MGSGGEWRRKGRNERGGNPENEGGGQTRFWPSQESSKGSQEVISEESIRPGSRAILNHIREPHK